MYIYEINESSVYVPEHHSWFIKDDEDALEKIKKIVMDCIIDGISECGYRISEKGGRSSYNIDGLLDKEESLRNTLEEVSRYIFISQFNKISLLSSNIRINKIEVL